MRHLKAGRKLNRSSSHRLALMRNLVTGLLRHERIKTTDSKAKELRRWADRMISLGKEGTLHARRQVLSVVQDGSVVRKVFETLAPRFKERPGGYTRIVKLGWRRGDSAPISLVELIPVEEAKKPEAAGGKKRRRAPKGREAKEESPAKEASS